MNEQEECYVGPERRSHCEMVVKHEQWMMDFLARYERDQGISKKWREGIDMQLGSVIKFISEIEKPYTVGLWAFRIFIAGMFVAMAKTCWMLIQKLHIT